jgi:hypothetical protein
MEPGEIKAVLEQLVQTVGILCRETADLVDDYSTRVLRGSVGEVRLKADKIRVAGRSLQAALDEANPRTDQ